MEYALEKGLDVLANNGLAIFLVVCMVAVGVFATWHPPQWFREWVRAKADAADRTAKAHETIADSTRSISHTAEEIKEALNRHDKDITYLKEHAERTNTWFNEWGEMFREWLQSTIHQKKDDQS